MVSSLTAEGRELYLRLEKSLLIDMGYVGEQGKKILHGGLQFSWSHGQYCWNLNDLNDDSGVRTYLVVIL